MILAETVREILGIPRMLNLQRNAVYRWNAFFEKRTERSFRLLRSLVKSVRGSSATSILVISLVNRRAKKKKKGFCTVLKVVHRIVTKKI